LLSGHWKDTAQADRSYFIDVDPDLFEHILRYYLRRPDVFPLFYDDAKGHGFLKYYALLGEARYFGIEPLSGWIEQRKYAEALSVEYTREKWKYLDPVRVPSDTTIAPYSSNTPGKTWICPQGFSYHMGDATRCRGECRTYWLRHNNPSLIYENNPHMLPVLRKRTILNV
jgi:phytoene desaturase (3,4-didehydrolycopene-forming)